MLIFVAAYVAVVVIAFAVYLIRYRKKDEQRKLNQAAERIVREDMLRYSLRNPYADAGNRPIPASRRRMLCITIKTDGKKHRYVFDPEKQVSVGRSDKNQIIIYDAAVSERQALIYVSAGKVCVRNAGNTRRIRLKRGGRQTAISAGGSAVLRDGDVLRIGAHELNIKLFRFDFNHK